MIGRRHFGRDAVGNCAEFVDKTACRAIGGLLKHDTSDWDLALGYDQQRGTAGVGAFIPSAQQHVRVSSSVHVTFSGVKPTAGRVSLSGGVATGSAPVAGRDPTGVMVGLRHSFQAGHATNHEILRLPSS